MSVVLMFVEDGQRHAEIVALKRVASQTASALLLDLYDTLSKVLQIIKADLKSKLVWFSSDGCSVIMGSINEVSTQLALDCGPFMEGIQYRTSASLGVSGVQIPYFQQI